MKSLSKQKAMYPGMTFEERAKIGMKMLAKQEPVTLEQARAQVQSLKDRSANNIRKSRP